MPLEVIELLEWLAYVAVLAACILRTTMPYWYKNKNGDLTFEVKYLGPMISAIIVGFIMSGFVFVNIDLPDDAASTILGFWTVFIAAWGTTDLFSKLGIDAWKKN